MVTMAALVSDLGGQDPLSVRRLRDLGSSRSNVASLVQLYEQRSANRDRTPDTVTPREEYTGELPNARSSTSLDNSAPVYSSPIHLVSSKGNTPAMDRLLDNGVDVNRRDSEERTPLHCSCQQGHLEATRLLLVRGANADAAAQKGATPLHMACQLGH